MTLTLYQALDIFEDNLSDIRKGCIENVEAVIKWNTPYKEMDVDEPITVEACKLYLSHLKVEAGTAPLFRAVRRIDSLRRKPTEDTVSDLDIQNAREVPEEWFISEAELGTRRPHKGVCPFHNDTDPSLTLMKSKTTKRLYLKCFPCGIYVDSIGFIMKRDNLDFISAVRVIIS